jgi:hypothetical protein
MILGQAAGAAAKMAIDGRRSVSGCGWRKHSAANCAAKLR